MNWRRWKMGLVVAVILGACQAFITKGLVPVATWKELLWILAVNIAVNVALFLKEHPIEQVEDK